MKRGLPGDHGPPKAYEMRAFTWKATNDRCMWNSCFRIQHIGSGTPRPESRKIAKKLRLGCLTTGRNIGDLRSRNNYLSRGMTRVACTRSIYRAWWRLGVEAVWQEVALENWGHVKSKVLLNGRDRFGRKFCAQKNGEWEHANLNEMCSLWCQEPPERRFSPVMWLMRDWTAQDGKLIPKWIGRWKNNALI